MKARETCAGRAVTRYCRGPCLKVLVVNPSLFAPHYDYHLCRALVQNGDSVTMVGRPLREYERVAGEPFEFAGLFYRNTARSQVGWRTSKVGHVRKGLEHAFGLRALERLAIDERADIVHFQWLVLPFLDLFALHRLHRRCGLVLTVHNANIGTHSTGVVVGAFGATLQAWGRKRAVLSFDRYIAHSFKTVDSLNALGIKSEQIVHLPHPPLELDAPSAPRLHSTANSPRDILFFGAIKPYKGVDILIEAGIEMAAKRRDFRITIAGRPFQSMETLLARIDTARARDVFRFDLDFVSDARLAQYLSAADIVVFPYREIDGSGALSHAIQFGKPIVASRVGGFSERPFVEYLELVPPNDVRSLAATLTELLDNPARVDDLSKKSSALRELLPSWHAYAQACQTAYREIILR